MQMITPTRTPACFSRHTIL